MLTQWFDPEPGPAAIPGVLAREFVRAGHEVSVLTGFPNYPEGKLHEGYRQRPRVTERVAEVSVTRVPLYPNHNSSAIGRVANYMSFAASAAIFGGRALKDADAVWVYNSPVSVSWPLFAHTHNGSVPYFLHVQDLWPDSLIESGMFTAGAAGKVIEASIRRVVQTTENRAAVIGVISPSVRELILSRNPGIPASKIVYVPNPADETLFVPAATIRAPRTPERQDRFELLYLGAMGNVQGLDTVLQAAKILASDPRITIALVGDGIARDRLEKEAAVMNLTNLRFYPRIGKGAVPAAIAAADANLVSLAASEFLEHTTPSKIASLLASEVPIIGQIAVDGADLLKESGSALIAAPGDAEGLAGAIKELADRTDTERQQMASSGLRYYRANLSAKVTAEKVVNALKESIT